MTSRRALGVCFLWALLPGVSLAMFAEMSDTELLQRSSLVVVGTWVGQDLLILPGAAQATAVGVVAVAETLKGETARTIVFVAVPNPSAPKSGSDISFRKGDRGLWLLRPHGSGATGLYLADSPQRFVSSTTGAARIQSLRSLLSQR